MFKLYDNRTELYQWDLNRKVIVSDETVTEVHFCNKTDDCSLVVPTYRLADANILVADIPNILLQDNWNIRCYAYCTDYTKVEALFKVKPRTKPSDYAYTETEVKSYDYLENKLLEIEEQGFSEETVNKAVDEHFDKHPINIYFTDDEAGNVTATIDTIPDAEEVEY